MRQSVRPTKRRSGRTGGFSKVALGHSRRFLGLGISGSRVYHCSSARSRVGSILVLMPLLALRRSTRSATVGGITSGLPTIHSLAIWPLNTRPSIAGHRGPGDSSPESPLGKLPSSLQSRLRVATLIKLSGQPTYCRCFDHASCNHRQQDGALRCDGLNKRQPSCSRNLESRILKKNRTSLQQYHPYRRI